MSKLLILFTVIARLAPHVSNFTPVGAAGLYAGARMNPRTAWMVPIIALPVGDMLIGFYDWRVMIFVYFGFLLAPLIGRMMLHGETKAVRIGTAVAVNAVVFYLVSNIGNWVSFYPPTFEGLVACYIAGLPYLGIALMGDSLYSVVFFGGFELIEQRVPAKWRFA